MFKRPGNIRNCTDDFNWQECSDTVPKYLENTSYNQYGHNKNTQCTNEADRKEIIETMKTSETNILQEITSTVEVAPFEAKRKFCEDEEKQFDPSSLLQMICTSTTLFLASSEKSTSKASPAMERLIHKVVLLHKTETREVPTEEQLCIFVKKTFCKISWPYFGMPCKWGSNPPCLVRAS